MKKFIQASAVSGICLILPQAKPMKISPKNGSGQVGDYARSFRARPADAPQTRNELFAHLARPLHSSKRDQISLLRFGRSPIAVKPCPRQFFQPLAIGAPAPDARPAGLGSSA